MDREEKEIRDEPAYNNMRPNNIRITTNGSKIAREKLRLLKRVAILGVATFVVGAVVANHVSEQSSATDTETISYIEEYYEEDNTISIDDCNLDGVTIVLSSASSNASSVVETAEKELAELGVSVVIATEDDLLDTVGGLKENNSEEEIIVINVDGETNKTDTSNVIMTNYSNTFASADGLALAIQCESGDTFGIESTIKCGEKTTSGRGKTDIEKKLTEAGYTDVACLTIAPTSTTIDEEIESNNLATAIAQGVIRVLSVSKDERIDDYIRRVEYGDTISQIAADNDVSEEYIESKNGDAFGSSTSIIRNDTALIVKKIPKNLTGNVVVDNPTVTTNSEDITTVVSTYTVEAGDTISQIAEKLGVSQDSFVVDDINKIRAGDEIEYEETVGPIRIQPKGDTISK